MTKTKQFTTPEKQLERAIESGLVAVAPTMRDFFDQSFGGASGKTNVILHRRKLRGDFNALAAHLAGNKKVTIDRSLRREDVVKAEKELKGKAKKAAQEILADIDMLAREGYHSTKLRLIGDEGYRMDHGYDLKKGSGVSLFHFDGGQPLKGRVLTAYAGATTQGIAPEDCIRFVDIPKFQQDLIGRFGQDHVDPKELAALMKRSIADIRLPKPGAIPYAFSVGDIFRHAVRDNKAGVTPHLHRAPPMTTGAKPRLLLVADAW